MSIKSNLAGFARVATLVLAWSVTVFADDGCTGVLAQMPNRNSLFVAVVRANVNVPQVDSYIGLKALTNFLLSPIPVETLLAPMSDVEMDHISTVLNRAHAAHHVPVRVDRATLALYPQSTFRRTFRNIVRIMETFDVSQLPPTDIKYTHFAPNVLEQRKDLFPLVNSYYLSDSANPGLRQVQERARRLDHILDDEEARSLTKTYRARLKALVEAGISGDELRLGRQPITSELLTGLDRLIKKEFSKDESDTQFRGILFKVLVMDNR